MFEFSNINDFSKKLIWLFILVAPGALAIMLEFRKKTFGFDGINFIFMSFFISALFILASIVGSTISLYISYFVYRNFKKMSNIKFYTGTKNAEKVLEAFFAGGLRRFYPIVSFFLLPLIYISFTNFGEHVLKTQSFTDRIMFLIITSFILGIFAGLVIPNIQMLMQNRQSKSQ